MVQPVVDLVRDPVIQRQWWAAFGSGFIALLSVTGVASLIQARGAMSPAQFLLVEGTMPRSPVLQNTVCKFPLIDRLIPPLLDGGQSFSLQRLDADTLFLRLSEDPASRRPRT